MDLLIAVLTLLLLGLVVLVLIAPLRRAEQQRYEASQAPAGAPSSDAAEGATLRRDELEAAREAKYREIRDAEMDYRTGKLSEPDYRALDVELRAEALRILDALDAVGGARPEGETGEGDR
ncbi:MAG: hypothetical protein ACLQBB_12040 [Solirubrobacteraceae bacterium]